MVDVEIMNEQGMNILGIDQQMYYKGKTTKESEIGEKAMKKLRHKVIYFNTYVDFLPQYYVLLGYTMCILK